MAFLEVFEDFSNQLKIYGKSKDNRVYKIDVIEFCMGKVSLKYDDIMYKLNILHAKYNLGRSAIDTTNLILGSAFRNPLFANSYRNLIDTPIHMGKPHQIPIMDTVTKTLIWGDTQESNSVTWDELVALQNRAQGDKYTVTTADPRTGIIYGKILLDTYNTFEYMHSNGVEEIIYIE
jgi:hypothetical protein